MKRRLSVKHMLLGASLLVSLTACGGGGGGGGVAPTPIAYTGLTTQAAVDENNAEDLSTGAYQGGQIGDVFSSIGAIQAMEGGPVGQPRTLKVAQVLADSLHKLDFSSLSGGPFVGAIATESGTIDGNCGGNASYSISVDDQSGDFSGSFSFNSYCENGTAISGAVSYFGSIDVNTQNLIEFSFSFDNLAVDSGNDSLSLYGDISFDTTVSTDTMTMTMLLKDNRTAKVYKLENYMVTLSDAANDVEFEVSGRYFDPDYGYVLISTTTPFRIYPGDDGPSTGVLVATGKTGISGSNTVARLTAISSTTFQVEADTTGDGLYDWHSGVLSWSSI